MPHAPVPACQPLKSPPKPPPGHKTTSAPLLPVGRNFLPWEPFEKGVKCRRVQPGATFKQSRCLCPQTASLNTERGRELPANWPGAPSGSSPTQCHLT